MNTPSHDALADLDVFLDEIQAVRDIYNHPGMTVNGYDSAKYHSVISATAKQIAPNEATIVQKIIETFRPVLDYRPSTVDACRRVLLEVHETTAAIRNCLKTFKAKFSGESYAPVNNDRINIHFSTNLTHLQEHVDSLAQGLHELDKILYGPRAIAKPIIQKSLDIETNTLHPYCLVATRNDKVLGYAMSERVCKKGDNKRTITALGVDPRIVTTKKGRDIAEALIISVIKHDLHPTMDDVEEGNFSGLQLRETLTERMNRPSPTSRR